MPKKGRNGSRAASTPQQQQPSRNRRRRQRKAQQFGPSTLQATAARLRKPAMVGSEHLMPMRNPARPLASMKYWDVASHLGIPPAVRQTVGRWSMVESVDLFQLVTSTTQDTYVWMLYTPSSLAAVWFYKTPGNFSAGGLNARNFTNLANASPLQVRPLRMTMELKNTTQVVNRAGAVFSAPIDQPLVMSTTFGANAGVNPFFDTATSVTIEAMTSDSVVSHCSSCDEAAKGLLFPSIPASWMAYNEFQNFVLTSVNDSAMTSGDWFSLVQATGIPPGGFATYPYSVSTSATAISGPALTPPMRGWLVRIPAVATLQTYTITLRRQEACRAAANSLLNSYAKARQPSSAASETELITHATAVSNHPPGLIDQVRSAGSTIAEVGGAVQGARSAWTTGLEVIEGLGAFGL